MFFVMDADENFRGKNEQPTCLVCSGNILCLGHAQMNQEVILEDCFTLVSFTLETKKTGSLRVKERKRCAPSVKMASRAVTQTDLYIYAQALVGTPYLDYRAKDATYDQAPWWMTAQPDLNLVRRTGAHCIGFFNLLLAQMGAPRRSKGTGYLWRDLRVWRRPLTATEFPQHGDLLLRCFQSQEDQGHVALLLPQGLVHCYWLPLVKDGHTSVNELRQPGVTFDATWEASHAWCADGYYEARVPFKDWISWAFCEEDKKH